MPGFLLHVTAVAKCPHGIPATVTPTNTRVFLGGPTPKAVLTAGDVFAIAGCPFTVGTKPQPCVRVQWVPATKVFVNAQPALIQPPPPGSGPGQGVCFSADSIPAGPPMVDGFQVKALAT